MSYASSNLDFMFWHESISISPKQQKRRRQWEKQAKKNLEAPVGQRCRCAICGKHFKKGSEDQVICQKNWCGNKLATITYK